LAVIEALANCLDPRALKGCHGNGHELHLQELKLLQKIQLGEQARLEGFSKGFDFINHSRAFRMLQDISHAFHVIWH